MTILVESLVLIRIAVALFIGRSWFPAIRASAFAARRQSRSFLWALGHLFYIIRVDAPFSHRFQVKKNTVGKQIGDSWRGTNEVFAWRKKNSASVVSCRYGPLDRCDLRDFFDENENSPHPKRINRVTWIDFPPTAQPIRLTLTGQQSWDGFTRNKCCTLQCLSFLVHGRCPWQLVKLTLNGQRPSGARLEFWSTVRSRCGQHSILVFFFTDRKKN